MGGAVIKLMKPAGLEEVLLGIHECSFTLCPLAFLCPLALLKLGVATATITLVLHTWTHGILILNWSCTAVCRPSPISGSRDGQLKV